MVKMPYVLIFVVLVFSIGFILYASPLILYVAPIIAFGILASLVKDFARNRSKMAAASKRRMTTMLERVGIDPAIDSSGDAENIMKEARQRCRSCTSVDVCERWLAGDVVGENYFCPNAKVFESLKRTIDAAA
jgi:hypothetical protein